VRLPGGAAVTPEANAVIGLFFGLWSHEMTHRYDENGKRGQLLASIVVGLIGLAFLGLAAIRALGLVR